MGAYNNVLWAIGSCGRCIFDYIVGAVLVVVYLVRLNRLREILAGRYNDLNGYAVDVWPRDALESVSIALEGDDRCSDRDHP
jgi:hypothetical protein